MIRANPCRTSSAGINSGMMRAGAPPSALRASADGNAAKKESTTRQAKRIVRRPRIRWLAPFPSRAPVLVRDFSACSPRSRPDIPAISRKLLHMPGILPVSSGSTRRRIDHIREFNTEIVSRHSRKSMTSCGARLNVASSCSMPAWMNASRSCCSRNRTSASIAASAGGAPTVRCAAYRTRRLPPNRIGVARRQEQALLILRPGGIRACTEVGAPLYGGRRHFRSMRARCVDFEPPEQ